MSEIYGIVINCQEYKDYDAIIDILTEDKVVPVWVRNANKPGSKFIQFLPIFTRGHFELYKGGYKYYKLKDGLVDNTLLPFYQKTFRVFYYTLIKELYDKTYSTDIPDRFYKVLNETLNEVNSNIELSFVTLNFVVNLIKIIGYAINVENHENAVAIDFSNGCFVDEKQFDELTMVYLSAAEVDLIYNLFTKNQNEVINEKNDIKSNLKLIKLLCDFLIYYNGIEINCFTYLDFITDTLIVG
ncbi:MAG: DNA repair protein RecO [Bacilli bacterium]|nr:DNA repair protein RecO [Bacilli bacterium]